MTQLQLIERVLKPATFVVALIPFAYLVWGLFFDALGANPVNEFIRETGVWGLRFLLITLCVTPLRRISGWNPVMKFRRMLGLYAFFYSALHLIAYVIFEAELDVIYVIEDAVYRMYITVGWIGLLPLIPLAITSTDGMVRRLGGKRWQQLHRLVYVAALASVGHYLLLVKADLRDPLFYLAILLLLMLLRLPPLARQLSGLRPAASSARSAR
ncbi:MAG TPA: protein-methionine-sulfoxide reductase heme-binding subunit MsrQ [Gammaproteobacteria bacterium]|nr:protein-methionine-sulfoxide reductase heme-binding subunit MsrQ [Gammaproteobacteria bacterium]